MACSVVEVLLRDRAIDPTVLAASFVERFEPGRGYGPKMKQILSVAGATGESVRTAAAALFDGGGSFGNGAVMRVAPLGAFFAGDPERAAAEGAASAVATHTHPEAAAGASAIAAAASLLSAPDEVDRSALFDAILDLTPQGAVRVAIEKASTIDSGERPLVAAKTLGADRDISCQVTTPFCLWIALRHPDDYERAVWEALSVGGDRDTHAAIVGGLLASRLGADTVPGEWLRRHQPLPPWLPTEPGG